MIVIHGRIKVFLNRSCKCIRFMAVTASSTVRYNHVVVGVVGVARPEIYSISWVQYCKIFYSDGTYIFIQD